MFVYADAGIVLILVLVEEPIGGYTYELDEEFNPQGLNPCFSGRTYRRTYEHVAYGAEYES